MELMKIIMKLNKIITMIILRHPYIPEVRPFGHEAHASDGCTVKVSLLVFCIHVHQGCESEVLLCCILFCFSIKSNAGIRACTGTSTVFSLLVKLRIGLTFFSLVESTANSPDPGFFFDRMMFITKTCYSLPVC